MKTLVKGTIENNVPFFKAKVCKGILVLDRKGKIQMTVDTGFSGGIALPVDVLEKTDAELAFYDTFKTATGEIIELPVYTGTVKILDRDFETWFIPGDSLLGTEFLSSVGNRLLLDFKKKSVSLSK